MPRLLGLRLPGTLIRFRFTDAADCLCIACTKVDDGVPQDIYTDAFPAADTNRVSELSIPAADFRQLDFTGICRCIIVENLLVYLTFPKMPQTLCIFGGGFAATQLAGCKFPPDTQLLYFGDLDEHGFAILSDFRGLFPQTRSFCMDTQTLHTFEKFRVKGAVLDRKQLPAHLTKEEQTVFDELRSDPARGRLEQERITQAYITEQAKELR